MPEVRPLFLDRDDIFEPFDKIDKPKMVSPIFLIDERFTAIKTEDDESEGEGNQLFRDNDFGEWRKPENPSKWPLVVKEVQTFFNVGLDCCQVKEVKVFTASQTSRPLFFNHYKPKWGPVYEPVYKDENYNVPKNSF